MKRRRSIRRGLEMRLRGWVGNKAQNRRRGGRHKVINGRGRWAWARDRSEKISNRVGIK